VITFLISVGVVCAISTALAVVMVIAELTIGNYGDVEITINDNVPFTARGGKTLLNTLKEHNVFIPSACGGRGSCGLCKCRVAVGGGELLPTELPWISDEEQKDNVRLSCQVKVKRNLRIEIDPVLLSVRAFRGRVTRMVDLTHDIKQVTVELLEPNTIAFKAGQYIQIETPEYALTDEPVYRAYSISSAPSDTRHIEMEIRLVPDGICTTYVHRYLKEGDPLTLNGPYGEFHLSDTDKEIIGIAGGSGMASLKSIAYTMRENGNPRRFRYFFGAKSKRDLFLLDEMHQLEADLPDFTFIPALSEPAPEDDWQGETGLITEVVERHIADASDMEAYLCGSPLMIDACIRVLKAKGMPETSIFFDKFA